MDYSPENDDRPICLQCGHEIAYGRKDKRYCSEKCRNRYHNLKHHDIRSVKLRILGALDRNYSVLGKLLQLGIHTMPVSDLAQMGYNKEYVTSCHTVGGHVEFRCFDIKFRCSDNRIYQIERVVPIPSSSGDP